MSTESRVKCSEKVIKVSMKVREDYVGAATKCVEKKQALD